MKPFSTYPEDRAKMLALAAVVEQDADASGCAHELADMVSAILKDEAVSISEKAIEIRLALVSNVLPTLAGAVMEADLDCVGKAIPFAASVAVGLADAVIAELATERS